MPFTCGQQRRATVSFTEKRITHFYYTVIILHIISETLAPQHACFSRQVSHSPSPSPLFFCSTSIRVVLDCRVRAQCSLWLNGASQTLSRSPVETRIGKDMGEQERERDREDSEKTEESTFFNSANIFVKLRRAHNETRRVLAGSWPDD